MHMEDGRQRFGLCTLRTAKVAGDGLSAETLDLQIKSLHAFHRRRDRCERRFERHFGQSGFLRGPEGIEVIRHGQARLDLQRIVSRGGQRGRFAAGGTKLQEAGLVEFAAESELAGVERHFLCGLRLEAVFAEHERHFGMLRGLDGEGGGLSSLVDRIGTIRGDFERELLRMSTNSEKKKKGRELHGSV